MLGPQFLQTLAAFGLGTALGVAQAGAQANSPNLDSTLRDIRAGQAALQQQNYSAAEVAFRRAIQSSPGFADAYLGLGLAELRSAKFAEAVEALKRATELGPQIKGAHFFLGIAEYQNGDADDAAAALRSELALQPDALETLTWLGIVELGRDHAEAAVVPLDHAAALNPRDATVLYYQVRAHATVAKQAMRTLYETDPDSALFHRALGETYSDANDPEKAIAEYQAALRKDPANADILEAMGTEQIKLGRPQEATESFHRELSLHPHSAIALYNLGRLDVQHGHPAEGVAELREALDAHARTAPTMFYLGFGLAQLGQNQEAAASLEKVLSSEPSPQIEQSALFQIARVYTRLGRRTEADQALARLKILKAQAVPSVTDDVAVESSGAQNETPAASAQPQPR